MAITPLTSSDTFQTWFNTTNTIISTVNGISGISGGISGPYVIAFNGLSGVVTFNNYVADFNGATGSVSGVTGIIGSSGILVSGTSTYPTITNTGVLSVNTQTGAITNIATLTSPQIFTELQQFTGGISASGATFSGNISAPNVVTTTTANTFTALQTFNSGITAAGATFNGNVAIQGNSTVTGNATITGTATITGNITAPNIVTSFNGRTGALQGVTSISGTADQITVSGATGNVIISLPSSIIGVTQISGATLSLRATNNAVPAVLTMASAAGGQSPNTTLTGNLTMTGGLTANSLNISTAVNIVGALNAGSYTGTLVNTFNGFTGAVSITGGSGIGITTANKSLTISNTGVLSFNGVTGAVTGVTTAIANTFTALQTFTAGISANGATFSGPISAPNVVTTTTQNKFTAFQYFPNGLSASDINAKNSLNVEGVITVGTETTIGEYGNNTNLGIGAGAAVVCNSEAAGNVGIGFSALGGLTAGADNVAIGSGALTDLKSVNSIGNVGIGSSALRNSLITNNNTGVGYASLYTNLNGNYNTGVGSETLKYIQNNNNNNTAIGYGAGTYRGTGTNFLAAATGGIYIGNQARASADNQTNEIVIGYDAVGLGSNTAVLGATLQQSATIYGQLLLPSGLSAAGITLTGNFTGATATFSKLLTASSGISASGATFAGTIIAGGTFNFGRLMDTTANTRAIQNAFKIVSKTGLSAEVCRFDKRYYNMVDITSTVNIIDQNTSQGVWPPGIGLEPAPLDIGYFIGRKDLVVHDGNSSDGSDVNNYVTAICLTNPWSGSWYWDLGCNINGNDAILYITPNTRQTAIFTGHYTLTPLGLTG